MSDAQDGADTLWGQVNGHDLLSECARECAGLNEETYRMIHPWERALWRARAKAAIDTYLAGQR